MNQQQYERSLAEIKHSSMSIENKRLAYALLKKRATEEYYANKSNKSGFSNADIKRAESSHQLLVQKAMAYGLPESIATQWPVSELVRYCDYKRSRKIEYDESELA